MGFFFIFQKISIQIFFSEKSCTRPLDLLVIYDICLFFSGHLMSDCGRKSRCIQRYNFQHLLAIGEYFCKFSPNLLLLANQNGSFAVYTQYIGFVNWVREIPLVFVMIWLQQLFSTVQLEHYRSESNTQNLLVEITGIAFLSQKWTCRSVFFLLKQFENFLLL